jgi:GNAT superfamily N-acetyltransferase
MALRVTEVFDVVVHGNGSDGFALSLKAVAAPWVKDYDSVENPLSWPKRFDMSSWQLFSAQLDGKWVGGAAVAFGTKDLFMLEGRRDLAVLWDIRVLPEVHRHGVGSALFRAAEAWARSRGCSYLKVETQNVNVPACRFYSRQGCALGSIHRFAYVELPSEIQLLWYKDIRADDVPR